MSTLDLSLKKPQPFVKKGRTNSNMHKVYGSQFVPSSSTSLLYANSSQPDKSFNTTQVAKSRNNSQDVKWVVDISRGLRSYNSAVSLHALNTKNHKRWNSIKSVYLPVCLSRNYRYIKVKQRI